MNIKEIYWKNFKSYGNKKQHISFSDDGSLILLSGLNGSGKTSIKDVIEFCLFGKCSGRQNKRLALTKLPNRINKALLAHINFYNPKNHQIKITRGLQPKRFKVYWEDEPFEKRFMSLTDKEREQFIGYNYDVFKSFISMSMNDFKNFISLTADDKRNLINKLFNLENLDILLDITKNFKKDIQKDIDNFSIKNESLKSQLNDYKSIIKKHDVDNLQDKLKQLKEDIIKYKPEYTEFEEYFKNYQSIIDELNRKLKITSTLKNRKDTEISNLKVNINILENKIELYKSGICPTCDTNLKDKKHTDKLNEFENDLKHFKEKLKKEEDERTKILTEDTGLRNKRDSLYVERNQKQINFNNLKDKLRTLNTEYKYLKDQTKPIDDIKEKFEETKKIYFTYKNSIEELKNKLLIYDELSVIFSSDGIRKKIIKNIVVPINYHLKEYLEQVNSPFNVKLDDNFDAEIIDSRNGAYIDSETMSNGEIKKVNLAIALSYLTLILKHKYTNILFLDEVFDSIDSDNIDLFLSLLKKLSRDFKINIIVVHHSIIDVKYFDRIIKTTKDFIFSDLEEFKQN